MYRFFRKHPSFFVTLVILLGLSALGAHAQQTITQIGGYKLIVPLPGGGDPAPTTLAEYVRFIYLWFARLLGLAGGVMLLVGGVRYVLAAGNPGKAQEARETISRALLGIVVVLASYLILQTINPGLVNTGAGEVPPVSQPLAKNYLAPAPQLPEGQCFSTAATKEGLGGTDCAVIGNGWLTSPGGCNNACNATEVCCICVTGSECASTQHTCAKLDAETQQVESYVDEPDLCGPYLRADCNSKCPASFPACVAGSCSQPVGEIVKLEITNPQHPREGNTVTPVDMNVPLNIVVRTPSQVATVDIAVYCPTGSAVCTGGTAVFTGTCTPTAEECAVLWSSGITGPGNWRLEAIGRDATGNVIPGAKDGFLVCGDCGPTASFTVSASGGDGTTACTTAPDTFSADAASGKAKLRFDGSASTSPGNTKLSHFEWSEEVSTGLFKPIYFGAWPGTIADPISLNVGTHIIQLRVIDEYGAGNATQKTVTVVNTCV